MGPETQKVLSKIKGPVPRVVLILLILLLLKAANSCVDLAVEKAWDWAASYGAAIDEGRAVLPQSVEELALPAGIKAAASEQSKKAKEGDRVSRQVRRQLERKAKKAGQPRR
jgi:hypothetical protein